MEVQTMAWSAFKPRRQILKERREAEERRRRRIARALRAQFQLTAKAKGGA